MKVTCPRCDGARIDPIFTPQPCHRCDGHGHIRKRGSK